MRGTTCFGGLCRLSVMNKLLWKPCSRIQNTFVNQVRCLTTTEGNLKLSMDDKTGIAVMKLARPPVNSLSLELLTEIVIGLEKLDNEKSCRGLILSSEVPKIFCAGLDIMEMYKPKAERLAEFWRTFQEMWIRLYGSRLATVADINGHSPAGGCVIATSCDYRIMAPGYTIGLNEVQLGIVAPAWVMETMLNTIGFRLGEQALQQGTLFSTEEAHKIGLVDKIVPQEQTMSSAQEEVQKWLNVPDFARYFSKTRIRAPTINRLVAKREDDIKDFVDFVMKDSIQKSLEVYLERLKSKKK